QHRHQAHLLREALQGAHHRGAAGLHRRDAAADLGTGVSRVLTHAAWDEVPGLRHGFLERNGSGVELPLATVRQVHGTRIVTAEADGERPEADGVATRERGLAVGIVTADCVPVLMLARGPGVVAAVHAGWRGEAAGVLESALAHLHTAFGVEPPQVEAGLGPAIGPCCYRVGPEVKAAFTTRTGGVTAPAWETSGDRLMLDLRLAASALLEAAGVSETTIVGPC